MRQTRFRMRPLVPTARVAGAAGVAVTVAVLCGACSAGSGGAPQAAVASTAAAVPAATATTQVSAVSPAAPTTEDEALAGAEKAYERYLVISQQVSAGGGKETAALDEVLTGDALTSEKKTAAYYVTNVLRSTGALQVVSMQPQDISLAATASGDPEVTLDVCLDLTGVDVLDHRDYSVLPASSPDRGRASVTVVYRPQDGGVDGWLVSGNDDAMSDCS